MSAGADLFDRAEEYDAQLERGLRLTGEDRQYFIRGRLDFLRESMPASRSPDRILDFGCGTGETTAALAGCFPAARVTGVDTAGRAIEHAAREHASERVDFRGVDDLGERDGFDLCYVNGVFHHIAIARRAEALSRIRTALKPDGQLALFENNPWNPFTRLVMRRIPFDRDAVTISPRAAGVLLRDNGFTTEGPARFLFFFPAALARLRGLEPHLRWFPLGGQYLRLARAGSTSSDTDS